MVCVGMCGVCRYVWCGVGMCGVVCVCVVWCVYVWCGVGMCGVV